MVTLLRLSVIPAILVVLGGAGVADGCTNVTQAAVCFTSYSSTIIGWTNVQFFNLPLLCKTINIFKSCLTQACGGQAFPQKYSDAITQDLNKGPLPINCDNPDNLCINFQGAIVCTYSMYNSLTNMTVEQLGSREIVCRVVGIYKECLSTSCGGLQRLTSIIPKQYEALFMQLDNVCGFGNRLTSSVFLVLCLCLSLLVFDNDYY